MPIELDIQPNTGALRIMDLRNPWMVGQRHHQAFLQLFKVANVASLRLTTLNMERKHAQCGYSVPLPRYLGHHFDC